MLKEEKTLADLQMLISKGRKKGFLTYEEINETLDEDVTSDRMDDMLMVLDEMGIQLVDTEGGWTASNRPSMTMKMPTNPWIPRTMKPKLPPTRAGSAIR